MVGKGSSNNWGVVDHVAGGVGGNMLLDRDLGNMVDLVVDIVANMLDNRGGGNSNWGSMSISGNSRSSMSIGGNSRGSVSISGNSRSGMSISGNSRGGMSNSCNSGSSIGSNSWSSDSVTSSNEAMSVGGNTSYKAMSVGGDTSYKTMSISASKELSISLSISNWSSKATGNDSREDNLKCFLLTCCCC